MTTNSIATATTSIRATPREVWQALVTPSALKQYMFGADVASDWKEGSAITWKGEMNGKAYEDKGVVLEAVPGKKLQYVHFSPQSDNVHQAANFHTVTITLAGEGDETAVSLAQNNNSSEAMREESEQNRATMLRGLKKYVEQ
jgi:uncharacterized protein YndB with AHSA1/START domain